MKFIHIADIHLGRIPDQGKPWSEKRRQEIYDTFYGVLSICNKEQIDLLLIAGDLFHRQPLLRELKELNYQFSKLSHTKVVIIAGNHDYISEHSHYKQFQWTKQVTFLDLEQLEQVYFADLNTTVYGLSYHHRDLTEPYFDDIKPNGNHGFHILLAHGGDEKNIPMNKKLISMAGFDYVALGHIHKMEFISDQMAYSGSLEPMDRNEIGAHGYIFGNLEFKTSVDIRFIPYAKRQYYHLQMEITPEMVKGAFMDQLRKQIDEMGHQHIYKIIIMGLRDPEISFHIKDFEEILNIVELEDLSIPDYDFEVLKYQNRDNIIGMFIEAIRQSKEKDEIADKALYYGMEALLKETAGK